MGAGYKTMSDLLIDFCEIGCLLKNRGLCLGDSNGIKHVQTSGMIHADKIKTTACAESKEKN